MMHCCQSRTECTTLGSCSEQVVLLSSSLITQPWTKLSSYGPRSLTLQFRASCIQQRYVTAKSHTYRHTTSSALNKQQPAQAATMASQAAFAPALQVPACGSWGRGREARGRCAVRPARDGAVTMMWGSLFGQKDRVMDLTVLGEEFPAVEVVGLRKAFKRRLKGKAQKSRRKEHQIIQAVDGVSFTAKRGEIFSLLGPNSSGKTTTLRCLATMAEPDEGSISYYGLDALAEPYTARSMIGFVAQSAGLDKVLTGREHLDLFADLAHLDRATKKRNVEALIDVLALDDFIDRQAGVYSGGVIRRLDLAIGLLHQPPILILDEPTVGLDIESRRVIWDVLRTLREQGATILLTSHYLEEVDVLSDRVAIMDKGVIIANGTPRELKDALGGDRVSVRLQEFTRLDEAELACHTLRRKGLAQEALINRLQNNSVELVVDSDDARVGGEIVKALSGIGFDRLFSFSQSKPSLDDVYLAATGKSLTDADAVAKDARDIKSMQKETMA